MSRWMTLAGLAGGIAAARRRRHRAPPIRALPRADTHNAQEARSEGEVGAGGFYATWRAQDEAPRIAEHIEFQFAGMAHQEDTARAGMWLFLSTEMLFFGGLLLVYMIYRSHHPAGFAEASRHAEFALGTLNTVILLTSSAVFTYGLARARRGDNRGVFWSSAVTAALGAAFLLLKGYEWYGDITKHLFPYADFAIGGADQGGAKIFWSYYFVATGLHGVHMIVGVGLVAWIAWRARRRAFVPGYVVPVEIVGLYWSFVDIVWCVLYPTIYLAGGVAL